MRMVLLLHLWGYNDMKEMGPEICAGGPRYPVFIIASGVLSPSLLGRIQQRTYLRKYYNLFIPGFSVPFFSSLTPNCSLGGDIRAGVMPCLLEDYLREGVMLCFFEDDIREVVMSYTQVDDLREGVMP